TFIKIGVGVLRKDEGAYDYVEQYEIVDSGKWTVERRRGLGQIHPGADRPVFGLRLHLPEDGAACRRQAGNGVGAQLEKHRPADHSERCIQSYRGPRPALTRGVQRPLPGKTL